MLVVEPPSPPNMLVLVGKEVGALSAGLAWLPKPPKNEVATGA